MATRTVTIVVATSSRHRLLEGLLKSLRDQTFRDFEIILVCIRIDKKMREISLEYGAKLLEDEGKGRCYARNLGMKKAQGGIVVFLDDDVVLEKNWLELIVKDFYSDSRIGGVGGIPITVKDRKISSHLAFYDAVYDLMINKAQGLTGWLGKDSVCRWKVDFLSGSNMAFRCDVLHQIGGFDENFYWSSIGEDVDLCLRVLKEGCCVILDPRAKAYHHSDYIQRWSKFHKNDPAFFFALADNQTYFPVKHHLVWGLKWLPYLLFRFSNAFYWMLRTRNMRIFFSYWRGIFRGRVRGKFWACCRSQQDSGLFCQRQTLMGKAA